MMCAVLKAGDISQVDLARMLGVSAPTVSRMVKALVSLTLVEQARAYDHRIRWVGLTERGRRLLLSVLKCLDGPGFSELAGRIASSWSHAENRVVKHTDRLIRHLRWIRYAFGDTAIRYQGFSERFDEARLRRPLGLVSAPPDVDEQLFEVSAPRALPR